MARQIETGLDIKGLTGDVTSLTVDDTSLVVENSGNVGFGTITPQKTADINGGLATRSNTLSSLSNQSANDYAIGNYSFVRVSSTGGDVSITGFSGGTDGHRLTLTNISGNPIILSNQDSSSSFGNRLLHPSGASITLGRDDSIEYIYDGDSEIWRHINK